jgi:hypothetical protein
VGDIRSVDHRRAFVSEKAMSIRVGQFYTVRAPHPHAGESFALRLPGIFGPDRGLGDTFPTDYVFSGAEIIYQATARVSDPLSDWQQALEKLRLAVTSNFDVINEQDEFTSGSIFFEFTVRSDFRSINDVKALIDGAAYSSGLGVTASIVRFVSNPRRDGASQPPVGTPGADPRYTAVPPGSVDTTQPPGTFDIGSAASVWGQQLGLDKIASAIGMSTGAVTLGAIGLLVVLLLKR